MPITLGNTTVQDIYPNPGAGGAQISGSDVFAQGWFTVANNSVIAQYEYGIFGQLSYSPEMFLAPGTYPIASSSSNPINGIRFRNAIIGQAAQVWGTFFYDTDPVVSPSAEFTSTVAPSGAITPANPTTILRKTTTKSVANTVVPTDLFNGEFTIPALTTTNIVRGTAQGDYLQNQGGGVTTNAFRLQLIFGGTTLFDTGAPGFALRDIANRNGWRLDFLIANQNSQNIQACNFNLTGSNQSGNAATFAVMTIGEGNYGIYQGSTNFSHMNAYAYNSGGINTSIAQGIQFVVINPTANANVQYVLNSAMIEIL